MGNEMADKAQVLDDLQDAVELLDDGGWYHTAEKVSRASGLLAQLMSACHEYSAALEALNSAKSKRSAFYRTAQGRVVLAAAQLRTALAQAGSK